MGREGGGREGKWGGRRVSGEGNWVGRLVGG